MLHVEGRAFGLWPYGVGPEVGPEIMFRKRVKPDAASVGSLVDADKQALLVNLHPSGPLGREIPHEAYGQRVLHAPAFRIGDSEPEHPGRTLLTSDFLQTSLLM